MMCKIEKLLQTKSKTSKVKHKKKDEVLSQNRPNSTRTSNVVSTSTTQNMRVLATSREEELHGLGCESRAPQQGEYVGVRVGPALLEARQREEARVYEVRHAQSREVVSSEAK